MKVTSLLLCAFTFAIGLFRTPELGVDTKRYLAAMDRYRNIDQISFYGEELGFKFLSILSNCFEPWSNYVFLFITWSLFFLLSARYLFVASNICIYALILFIVLIIPILGLTQIMYGVASAFFATALLFFGAKKYNFAIVTLIISILMHYSFIFFSIVLIACYILRNRPGLLIIMFIGIIIVLSQILIQTRYSYLFGGAEVSAVKLAMGFLVATTLVKKSSSNFDKVLRNFQFVGLILLTVTFFSNGALMNRAYTVFFFLHLPKISDTIYMFKYRNFIFFGMISISVMALLGGLYYVKIL